MKEKVLKWYKLADNRNAIDWQDNQMAIVHAGSKAITIAKVNNNIVACAHKCPHAGGIMADGFVDALGNVVCPLHRYKFSPTNGRNVSGEGYYLKVYSIEERADGIFVGFENNSLLDYLK